MSLRQVNTDEYHAAFALFIGSPFGAQIAAHQLVYALKNHFAVVPCVSSTPL